jgi:hypothetical protein
MSFRHAHVLFAVYFCLLILLAHQDSLFFLYIGCSYSSTDWQRLAAAVGLVMAAGILESVRLGSGTETWLQWLHYKIKTW